jgi:hypothetical protein
LQISFSSHLLLIIKLQFIFGPKMEDVTGDWRYYILGFFINFICCQT